MGQKIKLVSRLNLRFQAEDEKAWFRRRDCAHAAREAVKQQLRLDYFVAEQPATAVRAIQQSTLRGIHGKINDGLPVGPGRMTFPEPGTPGGALLRALTADVILGLSLIHI